jgi:hypothetical protein
MPTKRAAALFGARAATGVVGIAVAVAAVSAANFVPWPSVTSTPLSSVVAPQPSEQQRVCPGPLLTLAEDSSQASTATSVGSAATVSGAKTEASASTWDEPRSVDITAADNADSGNDGSPVVLTVPAGEASRTPPLIAGSQSQTAAVETLGGFAAASCAEAVGNAWLVGGSTDIGQTSLVLLANPTTVVASVDLIVYGETGQVDAPGSTGILVQPGEQRIISLAGLAPNLKSPVVNVRSSGGQVTASLEQSVIRGIEPGGVEMVGTTAAPADEQSIVGVLVPTAADPSLSTDVEGFSDETPTVRVLVPGTSPATVRLGIQSEDGQSTGASQQVELQPGIATEVPLVGVGLGSFTIRLESDQPIVAAARTSSMGATSKDFAWFSASAPLGGDFLASVAEGPAPALHLYNPGTTDVGVSVSADGGAQTDVTVAAGQAAAVPVQSAARYTVRGGNQLIASVSYSGDGLLSSFPLNPPGPLASPIVIYSR